MTTSPSPISFPDFCPTPGRSAYYDQERQAWQVFGYAQVQRVLSDSATFSPISLRLGSQGDGHKRTSLNDFDPPQYRQLRAKLASAFTPRSVATFEPRIRRLAHDLLNMVLDRGAMDVISDFAAPLSLTVVCEMLGVPEVDYHQLRQWSDSSMAMTTPAALQAFIALGDYFTTLVKRRRELPGEDLICPLFEVQIDGQPLTNAKIVNHCCNLLIAGNSNTKNWIGNTLACFDQHPDAMAQVQTEPELVPLALEEVLRYLPPAPTFPRVAAVDTVIDAQEVKAGQLVMAHIGSANRDETLFPHPDTFEIKRHPNPHLSFGHGIHSCLGAPLARLAANIALSTLFERLDKIECVPDGALEAIGSPFSYGIKCLPITFKRK
jgi:cytochrome P450